MSTTLDKTKGSLVGLACGDYLGMPYEFAPPYRVRSHFKSHKLEPIKSRVFSGEVAGYYTDDTSQAICLAESLVEHGFNPKDQFKRYKKWLHEGYATPYGDRSYGVGQHTFKALTRPYNDGLLGGIVNATAGGNGALMRCTPIGLRYHKDVPDLIKNSHNSAFVTHHNLVASWCCVILNLFISYILTGKSGKLKDAYCLRVLDTINDLPLELQNLLRTDFSKLNEDKLLTTGYSLNTLTIALYAFFTTNTFEDCVTRAISVGGDTDTQGTVAGALAGAYYGYSAIPQLWRKTLMRHDYIVSLAEQLYIKAL